MDKLCSFACGFRVVVFFSGSGFRDEVLSPLAQVPNPGCVSFPGSELIQGTKGLC